MKLLVFAHTPPPHHGQSFMVQLLLEVFGSESRRDANSPRPLEADGIECHHVNCRLSQGIGDIGQMRPGKLFRLVGYCLQAIARRFRHRVPNFYYIPAPGMRSALYRDWLVMLLCRPFFQRLILHWQAGGLAEWLEQTARPWERWITARLLAQPDLSIVLGRFHTRDGEYLHSRRIEVIPNAVPDPCPQFVDEILARRQARAAARQRLLAGKPADAVPETGQDPHVFRVLFLGLCARPKGLFDAVEAVALAARELAHSPIRLQLAVAGTFYEKAEQVEFEARIRQADLQDQGRPLVDYRGFVSGAAKDELLRDSDCLCFPTYYPAETFGIVLVEAMAYGLHIITTDWRGLAQLLPSEWPGIVEPRAPARIAAALRLMMSRDYDPALRARFLERYTDQSFARQMKAALLGLEQAPAGTAT